jgi:hypothetical protein
VDANPNCPACGGSGRDPEYTDVFNQRPCLRCWFGLDEPQRTAVIETTASQWVSAAPDDPATLRAQLAEARAKVERVTRERDEAQWALQQYEMNRAEILYEDTQRARDMHRRAQAAESMACKALRHGRAYAIRQGESQYWEAFHRHSAERHFAHLSNKLLRAYERAEKAERVTDAAEARARGLVDLVRELVDALPPCSYCDRPATRAHGRGTARFCDVHGPDVPEYPRAGALREAEAALREAGGEGTEGQ